MKKLITCFLSFVAFSVVYGQEKYEKDDGNPLIPVFYNYIKYPNIGSIYQYTNFIKDNSYWGKSECDGGPCKNGFYNKIEFYIGQTKMYATGELILNKHTGKSKIYRIKDDISIYYAENGQLAYSGKNNEKGYQTNGSYIIYQKNGEKYIEATEQHKSNRNITERKILYAEDGSVLADFETYKSSYNFDFLGLEYAHLKPSYLKSYDMPWHYNYRMRRPYNMEPWWKYTDHIAVFNKAASNISHGEHGSYSGFNHLGIYNHPGGKKIAGFILPALEENGNGSVVYVNDLPNNTSFYCVYFDGKLDTSYKVSVPAIEAEKLITELNNTTDYLHFHPLNNYFNVINIKSQNLSTHSGYGINYSTVVPQTEPRTFIRNAEIGFFENGKLNGLGYRVKMEPLDPRFLVAQTGHHTYKISYEYGFFKQGILKNGKSHSSEGESRQDLWNPIDIPGIKYALRNKNRNLYPVANKTVPFSSLKADGKTSIYIGAIERWATLTEVDIVNKKLKIKTDAGEVATIAFKDAPHLSTVISAENSLQTCKACNGKGKLLYTTYHTEYVRKSSTHEGIYYTTYYSYSYPKTVEKTISGTCNVCNGNGKKEYKNLEVVYLLTPISF